MQMEQVIGDLEQWNGFFPFGADEQAQERARLLDAKVKQREDMKCHCIGYALTIAGVGQGGGRYSFRLRRAYANS